jgi:hypothetical protein
MKSDGGRRDHRERGDDRAEAPGAVAARAASAMNRAKDED